MARKVAYNRGMEKKPPKQDTPPEERRGMAGPRAVAEFAVRLARKSFGKRGFGEATLLADWPSVVGSMLGAATSPVKIAFPKGERAGGTLHLKVASGSVALELQHQERLVIDRVNAHLGYGAIARLSYIQGPLPTRKRSAPRPAPQLSEADRCALDQRLGDVADDDLKAALERLGRHLAGR